MRSTETSLLDFEEHWNTALDTFRVNATSRHRRRFVITSLRRVNVNCDSFLFDYGCGPGFTLEDGWLVATDVPGLGCTVDLG